MEWKDITGAISKAAPLIGTLIGGPAGAAVGGLVSAALGVDNTPDAVHEALKTNPEVALKLAQLESDQRVQLQTLAVTAEQNRLQAETAQAQSINATMQTEATSEHWATYSWRPFIGFAVAIDLVVSVVVVSAAYGGVIFGGTKADILAYIPAFLGSMAALVGIATPILGIASYFRGKMQADPSIPTINRG